MSGIRWGSFRQGDRAELMADFLLSSIGISTPVRRQDDLGVDFHCQLADEHPDGYLSFRSPFVIQVKSNISRGILFGENKNGSWRQERMAWLFQNKVPFFIGEVDMTDASLAIYDTTGLWQVYNKGGSWASQVELKAKKHPEGEMRHNIVETKLENWPAGDGDGIKYTVDIGNPLVVFSFRDLDNKHLMLQKKSLLTAIIQFEQKNIVNRDLGMRVFTEIKENISPGSIFQYAMTYSPHPQLNVNEVIKELYDGLVSVLIKLKDESKIDACNALKEFLKFAPRTKADNTLYHADPELFDFLKPTNDLY